jgi:hypothetical protein
MNLRVRVAMAEATSSGFYERQGMLRLARPEDARGLGWFVPSHEQVRDEQRRLPWSR